MNNKEWSKNVLDRLDPSFKHRWEIFDQIVQDSLNDKTIWIDCGCGNNGTIAAFEKMAKQQLVLILEEQKLITILFKQILNKFRYVRTARI